MEVVFPTTLFLPKAYSPWGNHFQFFLLFLLAVTSPAINKMLTLLFLGLSILEHIFPLVIAEDCTFLYHHSHLFSPILLIYFSCYFSVSTVRLYNVLRLCYYFLSHYL